MTNPVIEAMARAVNPFCWEENGVDLSGAQEHAIKQVINALKALEENITDEMVWAARGTGDMAEMMVDKEVRKVFTAMLKAARGESQ